MAAIKPPIGGPEPGAFTVYLRGVSPRKATGVRVLRTDVEPAREVARFSLAAGKRKAVWDGKVGGAPAPPGTYIVVPAVEDRAGNIGTAPAELPPSPDAVPGRPGITVRTIAGSLPTEPVRAGQRVRFFVDSRRRDFSWRVRRLGGGRVRARGRGQPGKPLSVKAPSGVSGVYLLQVRSGRYATQVPFAVQSSERADVQVVLPVISWLGLDPVDDDGNGVPNTLSNGGPVRYAPARLLAGGADRLPAGFADEVAPLLVYLDRARIRYDVTTDLALVGSRSPRAGDRKGVLLPGSMRWVPRDVARRLRRYVQDGGHVASFGTDTLRRGVRRHRQPPGRSHAAHRPRPVRHAPRPHPARARGRGRSCRRPTTRSSACTPASTARSRASPPTSRPSRARSGAARRWSRRSRRSWPTPRRTRLMRRPTHPSRCPR